MFIVWRRIRDNYVGVSMNSLSGVPGFEILAELDDWPSALALVKAKRQEIPQPTFDEPA